MERPHSITLPFQGAQAMSPTNLKRTKPVLMAGLAAALSAFAGAAFPSSANAQAVLPDLQSIINTCLVPGTPGCSLGDKTVWDVTFDPLGSGYSAADIGINAVQNTGVGFDNYVITANFQGLPTNSLLLSPITISYRIAITDPSKLFAEVAVDSTYTGVSTGTDTLTKDIYLSDKTTLVDSLISLRGSTDSTLAVAGLTELYIVDRYNPIQQGLQSASNTFTQVSRPTTSVPGPLPLLGAGVAFGFSRKLRRRISLSSPA